MLTKTFLDGKRAEIEAFYTELCTLSELNVSHRPAPERWSIKQVIGHLIDSAANNHQRFIRLQVSSELLPFYDQNAWVAANQYQTQEFGMIARLWRDYNLHILHLLAHIPAAALANLWMRPDNTHVTLAFVIEDYFAHLDHHISKVRERYDRPLSA